MQPTAEEQAWLNSQMATSRSPAKPNADEQAGRQADEGSRRGGDARRRAAGWCASPLKRVAIFYCVFHAYYCTSHCLKLTHTVPFFSCRACSLRARHEPREPSEAEEEMIVFCMRACGLFLSHSNLAAYAVSRDFLLIASRPVGGRGVCVLR